MSRLRERVGVRMENHCSIPPMVVCGRSQRREDSQPRSPSVQVFLSKSLIRYCHPHDFLYQVNSSRPEVLWDSLYRQTDAKSACWRWANSGSFLLVELRAQLPMFHWERLR